MAVAMTLAIEVWCDSLNSLITLAVSVEYSQVAKPEIASLETFRALSAKLAKQRSQILEPEALQITHLLGSKRFRSSSNNSTDQECRTHQD